MQFSIFNFQFSKYFKLGGLIIDNYKLIIVQSGGLK